MVSELCGTINNKAREDSGNYSEHMATAASTGAIADASNYEMNSDARLIAELVASRVKIYLYFHPTRSILPGS